MSISVNEIITGRKTFFITPDLSLLPETFLEDYFALGYECYYITNDKRITIQRKLDILISLFKDVIFFFNIDYHLPGVNWEEIIRYIINKYKNNVNIGVLYGKRQSREEKMKIEKKYLFDYGLGCGCIQLEYQRKLNFDIITKILYANQAQGRRKNIRAICTKACTFSVMYKGKQNTGVLQDISLSHFSLVYPEGKMDLKMYEKVQDFHFNIRGFLFRADAILIMQRPAKGEMLYIFSFISPTGANGLDPRISQLLLPNVYQLMTSNCKNLIDQMFAKDENDDSSGLEDFTPEELI